MPSYRCEVAIGELRNGVTPPQVLPAAEAALAVGHRVEGRSVELVAGRPEIHLRFLVPASHESAEDDEALSALFAMVRELDPVAGCERWVLKRGPGRNWRYLASGDAAQAWAEAQARDGRSSRSSTAGSPRYGSPPRG